MAKSKGQKGPMKAGARHHAVWRAEAALGCGSLLSAKTQATNREISPSPFILNTPLATMLDVGNFHIIGRIKGVFNISKAK